MNDAVLSKAMTLFFILIGINAFLVMGSALYDTTGHQLDLFYGLSSGELGSGIEDEADAIDVSTGLSFNSESPSQNQGSTPFTIFGIPIGIEFWNYIVIMALGVELVMLKFAVMFPIIAPITGAISFFGFALKIFVGAYLGSQLARAIVGRFR